MSAAVLLALAAVLALDVAVLASLLALRARWREFQALLRQK